MVPHPPAFGAVRAVGNGGTRQPLAGSVFLRIRRGTLPMDPSSLLGLVLGAILMAYAIWAGGGSLWSFVDGPSLLLVLGGLLAAALVAFPLRVVLGIPRIVARVLFPQEDRLTEWVRSIIDLSAIARREGLLALEPRLSEVEHPFLLLGLRMAVDGSRPEAIDEVLRTEMETTAARQAEEQSLVEHLGRCAPALGMIGTLLGLVTMLGNLADPSQLAAGMAMALITTLYGAVAANLVFLPLAERLANANARDRLAREILLRGLQGIVHGEHPRLVEQELSAYLSEPERTPLRRVA